MPFPCHKLTPLSNHEFRAREQGGLYGDGQAGGREVAEANVRVPTTSPFMFEFTAEAAAHNTSILEPFDYDLATAIDAFLGTTISPGSDLRPPEQLEPLLSHHPT